MDPRPPSHRRSTLVCPDRPSAAQTERGGASSPVIQSFTSADKLTTAANGRATILSGDCFGATEPGREACAAKDFANGLGEKPPLRISFLRENSNASPVSEPQLREDRHIQQQRRRSPAYEESDRSGQLWIYEAGTRGQSVEVAVAELNLG